jgi:hypothetical protein
MTPASTTRHHRFGLVAAAVAALALTGCGELDDKPIESTTDNSVTESGETTGTDEQPEPEQSSTYVPDPNDTRTGTAFFVPFQLDDAGNITSYYFAQPTWTDEAITCARMAEARAFVGVFSVETEAFVEGTHLLNEGVHYFDDISEINQAFHIGASEGSVTFDVVDHDDKLASGSATFMVGHLDWQQPEQFEEETHSFDNALICY